MFKDAARRCLVNLENSIIRRELSADIARHCERGGDTVQHICAEVIADGRISAFSDNRVQKIVCCCLSVCAAGNDNSFFDVYRKFFD